MQQQRGRWWQAKGSGRPSGRPLAAARPGLWRRPPRHHGRCSCCCGRPCGSGGWGRARGRGGGWRRRGRRPRMEGVRLRCRVGHTGWVPPCRRAGAFRRGAGGGERRPRMLRLLPQPAGGAGGRHWVGEEGGPWQEGRGGRQRRHWVCRHACEGMPAATRLENESMVTSMMTMIMIMIMPTARVQLGSARSWGNGRSHAARAGRPVGHPIRASSCHAPAVMPTIASAKSCRTPPKQAGPAPAPAWLLCCPPDMFRSNRPRRMLPEQLLPLPALAIRVPAAPAPTGC